MSKEAKEKEVIKKIKEILKRQGVEFEAVEVELKKKRKNKNEKRD